MNIVMITFWVSIILFLFPYLFYPLIIKVLASFKKEDNLYNTYKSISIIIPAYNEKNVIEMKIKNCLELNYPSDKIEILIGSDGSDDGTNEVVSKLCEQNLQIKFFLFPKRRGKISVLNDLVNEAKNDILVFSDANCILNEQCLVNIDKHFCDKSVGCVSGVKKIVKDKNNCTSGNEGIYWKFESFIKKNESKFNSLIGADGAILAINKEFYVQQNNDTILDDFMISINVLKKYNKRVIYDTEVIAYEEAETDFKKEFRRKTRISAGAFQALRRLGLFNPFSYFGVGYLCHKIFRWISPIFLLIMLISNVILLFQNKILYIVLFLCQLIYYLISYIGYDMENKKMRTNKIVSLIFYFNLTIFAQFVGLIIYITNTQKVTWDKQNR